MIDAPATTPEHHLTEGVVAPELPPCECPRCGYDLSALPPTWEEACPLCGQCSECGLEIQWSDFFTPDQPPPEWFAEREGSRLPPGPRMSRRTWWRVLRPWHFWSAIRLRHRPDPNALWGFTFVSVAMIYACAASWVLYQGLAGIGRPGAAFVYTLVALVWPWERSTNPYFWIVPVASIVAPLVFIVLGTTLSQARVKGAHIWRAGVYGVLGVATIMLAFRLARIAILLVSTRNVAGPPRDPWQFLQVCGFRASWAMVVAGVWLGVYWWFAVSRYLKLEHPHAVAASVLTIAFLTGLATVQWWPGSQWDWWRQSLFQALFW
jgi:hypothetical protein